MGDTDPQAPATLWGDGLEMREEQGRVVAGGGADSLIPLTLGCCSQMHCHLFLHWSIFVPQLIFD